MIFFSTIRREKKINQDTNDRRKKKRLSRFFAFSLMGVDQ
jgi:hypothetical protein